MGFEQDYCQGLRNKLWGKAMKAFALGGSDDQVIKQLKTAMRLFSTLRLHLSPKGLPAEGASAIKLCPS